MLMGLLVDGFIELIKVIEVIKVVLEGQKYGKRKDQGVWFFDRLDNKAQCLESLVFGPYGSKV